MNSDATITTNKLEDTLSVPNSAIKPYQGGRAVRIPEGKDKVKFVPVVYWRAGNYPHANFKRYS